MKKIILSMTVACFFFTAMGLVMIGDASSTCPSGAICRADAPGSYSGNGPYSYSTAQLYGYTAGATVYYPTNATAPFSSIVFMQPYTGTQSMDAAWGPFFASWGFVYVNCSSTTTGDSVDSRATQQANAVTKLKAENTRTGSVLKGKLNTSRIGLMGWSMGGGATWINSATSGFKSAMTLAGHNYTAINIASKGGSTKCPTMLFSGLLDQSILGGLGQSEGVYTLIPSGIAKIHCQISTAGHMVWGSPTSASTNVAKVALAFQKTFLDGDTRWVSYIARPLDASIWNTANLPQ